MRRLVVVVVLGMAACESPNPRSCADGICNDQSFPFCDVDGQLAGHPLTCIAVSCTPGDFAECRGDQAVTCNAMGNDYDVTKCERGCSDAAGGCNGCAMNSDCANPTPFCDLQSHSCRGCRADSECPSQVCDLGTANCVPEASVVYASPAGAGVGSCTAAAPCSLGRAVTVATTAATTPVLRLLPGTYSVALEVRSSTPQPLVIDGRGANIVTGAPTAFVVTNGANVIADGLTILAAQGISCGEANVPMSTLALTNISVAASGNSVGLATKRCAAQVVGADFSMDMSEVAMVAADDSSIIADRIHVHAAPGINTNIAATGSRVKISITNSLLENTSTAITTSDTAAPGSQIEFLSDTFIIEQFGSHSCTTSSQFRAVLYDNSILASRGQYDPVTGDLCTFHNTILFPESQPLSGAVRVDPRFVSAAAGDFHLASTSPAIDAATVSTDPRLAHDFDGKPRPQGAKPDIGAFEFGP